MLETPAIELAVSHADLDPLVDQLLSHHWTTEKIQDGWVIDRSTVKAALIRHLEQLLDSYVNIYGAEDHMHGLKGTALRHQIVEAADKAFRLHPAS